MRRTVIVGLLMLAIAVPLYAQRRGGGGFRSTPHFGGSVGIRPRGPVTFRSGISFGHNPRFGVFVNSRPRFRQRRFYSYPYVYYSYPYVYPVYPYAYPMYPLSTYTSSYDYAGANAQRAYPSYVDEEQVGLAEQMRQQRLGMYAQQQPDQTEFVTSPRPQPAAAPEPDRRPPTVLVYRDGHSAEVRNYAVVGQTLWIFSEERSQKVSLSLLDLDATRKANEERGVEFAVPAIPR